MSRVKKKLLETKGSSYIDIIIGFFVMCVLLALIIQVVPALILKSELGNLANAASRMISVEGRYGTDVQDRIEDYMNTREMEDVSISLVGTKFISTTDKVQLNDLIVVEVRTVYDLGFFSFGSIPITLTNKAEARSEVYWK